MAVDFSIKQHDRLPSIASTLTAAGAPVDLTTATSVSFIMAQAGATPKVNATATIVSAPAGTVRYDWLLVDTSLAGTFRAEWEVTWTGGKQQTFPTRGYLTVEIVADLDGS